MKKNTFELSGKRQRQSKSSTFEKKLDGFF